MKSEWKRRFVVFPACLALAGITMGQEEGCDTSTEEPSVESGKKGGGGSSKVAGVGDKMTLKGTAYQVTGVQKAKVLGETEFDRVKANGQFVIVRMTLTNKEDEPATILEDNIRLVGGNGKNYSTSDDALFAFPDQSFLLEEIQPDNSEKGVLVYDLPANAVSGAKIEVTDLFSDSKGQIDLGL